LLGPGSEQSRARDARVDPTPLSSSVHPHPAILAAIVMAEPRRRQPRPNTVCDRCDAAGSLLQLDQRCACGGRFVVATEDDDWTPCRWCAATGRDGGECCAPCRGAGWVYVWHGDWTRPS